MGKHDDLISYIPKPDRPGENVSWDSIRKIVWMDNSFMPGAMYFEIMWYCGPRDPGPPPHTHDFDEIIGFVGGDPSSPKDLNAVVKFKLDDEWYTFTQSVLIFIPAGMEHSPMHIVSVEKPFIHFSGGAAAGSYVKKET